MHHTFAKALDEEKPKVDLEDSHGRADAVDLAGHELDRAFSPRCLSKPAPSIKPRRHVGLRLLSVLFSFVLTYWFPIR